MGSIFVKLVNNNNNNNNTKADVYGVVIITDIAGVNSVDLMNVEHCQELPTLRPCQPVCCYCLHPSSPFNISMYWARQKIIIPQEKFDISGRVVNFFTKFAAFTEEDLGHIFCKFQCNILLHSKIITI